jgi:hypothetical protein
MTLGDENMETLVVTKEQYIRDLLKRAEQAEARLEETVKALREACQSLKTLSLSGSRVGSESLQDMIDVRGYAASRSSVAVAALERMGVTKRAPKLTYNQMRAVRIAKQLFREIEENDSKEPDPDYGL